ncbi:hypothetical protein AB1N83_012048 [Pleurotus pulmonarius]
MECIICWDALKQPVSIPCGHIFCEDCLENHRGKKASTSLSIVSFSCPVCRTKYTNNRTTLSLVRRLYLPTDDSAPYATISRAATVRVYEELLDHNNQRIVRLENEVSQLRGKEMTCNTQLRDAILEAALCLDREKRLAQELKAMRHRSTEITLIFVFGYVLILGAIQFKRSGSKLSLLFFFFSALVLNVFMMTSLVLLVRRRGISSGPGKTRITWNAIAVWLLLFICVLLIYGTVS